MNTIPNQSNWIFTEDQRDAVCRGNLCPACLGNNIKNVSYNFDGMNMNAGFDCLDCNAKWEGY